MGNTTAKTFNENLGGTTRDEYIGKEGELFWDYDPNSADGTTLWISDGVTEGGVPVKLDAAAVPNSSETLGSVVPVYGGNVGFETDILSEVQSSNGYKIGIQTVLLETGDGDYYELGNPDGYAIYHFVCSAVGSPQNVRIKCSQIAYNDAGDGGSDTDTYIAPFISGGGAYLGNANTNARMAATAIWTGTIWSFDNGWIDSGL